MQKKQLTFIIFTIKCVPSVAQFLQIYYTIINVMCYIGSVEIHIHTLQILNGWCSVEIYNTRSNVSSENPSSGEGHSFNTLDIDRILYFESTPPFCYFNNTIE